MEKNVFFCPKCGNIVASTDAAMLCGFCGEQMAVKLRGMWDMLAEDKHIMWRDRWIEEAKTNETYSDAEAKKTKKAIDARAAEEKAAAEKAEAERLEQEAKAEAERLEREAKAEAERLEREAKAEAERLEREAKAAAERAEREAKAAEEKKKKEEAEAAERLISKHGERLIFPKWALFAAGGACLAAGFFMSLCLGILYARFWVWLLTFISFTLINSSFCAALFYLQNIAENTRRNADNTANLLNEKRK